MSIPLSSLYLPGLALYQSRAAAMATIPNLPAYDPTQAPKYWVIPIEAAADPDALFTIHNLHDAAGVAKWSISGIPNSQAAALNIPPDPTSATNAPVYPPSVPIPMTYPLPNGESVIDTPFGLILNEAAPAVAPGSPVPAGTDPVLAAILANSRQAVTLLKGTPV